MVWCDRKTFLTAHWGIAKREMAIDGNFERFDVVVQQNSGAGNMDKRDITIGGA